MSFRPDSTMARRMLRPMRPKPFIATRTAMSVVSREMRVSFRRPEIGCQPTRCPGAGAAGLRFTQPCRSPATRSAAGGLDARRCGFPAQRTQRGLDDRLGDDAEVVINVLGRGARAEARHADENAVAADQFVPAEA